MFNRIQSKNTETVHLVDFSSTLDSILPSFIIDKVRKKKNAIFIGAWPEADGEMSDLFYSLNTNSYIIAFEEDMVVYTKEVDDPPSDITALSVDGMIFIPKTKFEYQSLKNCGGKPIHIKLLKGQFITVGMND
jgi:hypothetical protein